jgi:hypothetical protein
MEIYLPVGLPIFSPGFLFETSSHKHGGTMQSHLHIGGCKDGLSYPVADNAEVIT